MTKSGLPLQRRLIHQGLSVSKWPR